MLMIYLSVVSERQKAVVPKKSFKGKFRNADRHDNQDKIRELQYRAFPMYYSARM